MCKGIALNESSYIENIPTLIAAFSALILVLSVTYDYGFLFFLGISFSEVPTSLSDHVRSSLDWVPYMFVGVFIAFILELFFRRVEKGMTEDEIINTSSTPRFTAWFRELPMYFIIAFAIFIPIAHIFKIKLPLETWMFSTIIWWFILHNFFFGHYRIIERTTKLFYFSSLWVPAAILYMVFSGAISAENVTKGNVYTFNVQGEEYDYVLVRSYDKYFMVWNPDTDHLEFLSASSVHSFRSIPEKSTNKDDNSIQE